MSTTNPKYVIVRVFLSQRRRRVIKRGLTLAKAKAHIASPKAIGRAPETRDSECMPRQRLLYVDGYRAA